jgi:hypothetical protein
VRQPAKTKAELLAKIEETRKALDSGLGVSASYTVRQCLDDFLDSLEGPPRRRSNLNSFGHSRTSTFELVYRHNMKPCHRAGQNVMDSSGSRRARCGAPTS